MAVGKNFTQDRVDRFMITGYAHGNPHAMTAAFYFADRCEGLGLNAPLLPTPVSKEVGVKGAIGMDSLPTTQALGKPYMAWYFTVLHPSLVTFASWLSLRGIVYGHPNLAKDSKTIQRFSDSLRRASVRGSVGGIWESAGGACYE
jgi:hypothetical protein